MAKFSIDELLMQRAKLQDLSVDLQANLLTLQGRLNEFFAGYKAPIRVTSGYRPAAVNNATQNAAKASKHLTCQAADLACTGNVWQYCIANLEHAQRLGLWFEDKRWTPTWVHLQIVAPKSGNRIFVPSNAPALAPKAWSATTTKNLTHHLPKNLKALQAKTQKNLEHCPRPVN